ncbi:MAG TPA: exonuclease domain-containing protein [Balneolales bacterium]|nr:exonuclease domain-containing protein [Balneolales bacterium]
MMFSIFDLETTGFSPTRGDKIIEIGVVKINENDQIVDKYSTLINPERDISNYYIHGIEPGLVKHAPAFREVKHFVKSFLNGSTLVAHNASFDLRFLENELVDQKTRLDGVCTIKLSRSVDASLSSRRLDVLCEYYDIEINNSHEALSDALATAKLFIKLKDEFLSNYGIRRFRQQFVNPVSFKSNSLKCPAKIEYRRSEAFDESQREKNKLQDFIKRLPTDSITVDENSKQYLDTLTEILSDRIISHTELIKLEELVEEFGLSKVQIVSLHKQYLIEVIKVYLLDGKISDFERNDLVDLTQLLGLKQSDIETLIASAKAGGIISNNKFHFNNTVQGKSICFTGQLQSRISGKPVERSLAQKIAQQHGMIIKKNVSKKLDYLVAADPNTMSGKAKKAREYGLKILAEPEFWRLIGMNVD